VVHDLANFDARLSAIGSPSVLTGELEFEARAAGEFGSDISATAVRLTAKAAFSFEEGDIAIQQEDCAKIQIEGLSVKSVLTLSKPLLLCLRSRSESSIRISKDGAIETDLELAPAEFAADLQIGGESQRVSGELPALRVRASRRGDEFEASLETEAGRLEFAKQAVGIRDIKLEAKVSHGAIAPKGHLRIEEIFDTQQAARFQKLALNAQFEPRDSSVDFAMELANPNRDLVIEINGTHNLSDAAGRARLHLHAIDFNPGGLQPATLFPILADLLTEASGSIEMKGSVEWNTDGMRGTVEVAASDVSATSEFATVEHLNAIVELNENGATSLDQTVSIGRLDFGLELTDGLIRYRLKPGGIVSIESTSWKLNQLKALRKYLRDFLKLGKWIEEFRLPKEKVQAKKNILPTNDQLAQFCSYLPSFQIQIIFLLLLNSGLRIGEIISLKFSNINFDQNLIDVSGVHKGETKFSRFSFFTKQTSEYLNGYIQSDEFQFEEGNEDHSKLFTISARTVQQAFKDISELMGISLNPHRLRTIFAEKCREAKIEKEYIDAFCGRTPQSVLAKNYTDYSPKALRRVYDQVESYLIL
ncbi:MAG: site-specific integrase, partial [Candidatus Marinimicrobia bacterium]|nr:site-specific integrase [Candidatus Neomarinimicrobiota bacterium]